MESQMGNQVRQCGEQTLRRGSESRRQLIEYVVAALHWPRSYNARLQEREQLRSEKSAEGRLWIEKVRTRKKWDFETGS